MWLYFSFSMVEAGVGTGWPTMRPIIYMPATRGPIYGLDNIALLAASDPHSSAPYASLGIADQSGNYLPLSHQATLASSYAHMAQLTRLYNPLQQRRYV